jgi:hypothetical protein
MFTGYQVTNKMLSYGNEMFPVGTVVESLHYIQDVAE